MVQKKSLKNLKPVKLGQVLNPHGRPKKISCIPDILREIGDEVDPKTGAPNLETVMRIVYNKALQGAAWAVEFIAERCEGKVAFRVEALEKQRQETPLTDEQKIKIAVMLDGDTEFLNLNEKEMLTDGNSTGN
jgi:hypothetical protein